MTPCLGRDGVSPIMAILILISITLVLAGVVVFIVAKFIDYDRDTGEMFFFNVDADGSDDTLELSLIKGSLNTSRIRVRIEGVLLNHSHEEIRGGDIFSVPAGIDIVPGEQYYVTITVDGKMSYMNTLTARQ